MYRALVARANYLANDRSDIGFEVKELCMHMSSPRQCDWDSLKRLGRYLLGLPRVIANFEYQSCQDNLRGWIDTDHAGCTITRKSTS